MEVAVKDDVPAGGGCAGSRQSLLCREMLEWCRRLDRAPFQGLIEELLLDNFQ